MKFRADKKNKKGRVQDNVLDLLENENDSFVTEVDSMLMSTHAAKYAKKQPG